MDNYLTYTKFFTKEEAEAFAQLLDEIHVPYSIKHDRNPIPDVFIGETPDPMVLLKIAPEDFNKVNEMMARQAEAAFRQPDFSHYFLDFSRDELRDVLKNPNDWNAYDYKIASLLLSRLSLQNADEQPTNFDAPDYLATYKPQSLPNAWIWIGYFFGLFLFAGIFAGLAITQARKALPDGRKVPIYDRRSIRHGRNMITWGCFLTLIQLAFRFTFMIKFYELVNRF